MAKVTYKRNKLVWIIVPDGESKMARKARQQGPEQESHLPYLNYTQEVEILNWKWVKATSPQRSLLLT